MNFTLEATFPTTPSELYHAWLDSTKHTAMTGGKAICSDKIGDEFSAWDGYISGKNMELFPDQKIIQTWRTSEFTDEEEDSIIELLLEATQAGTKITLLHSNLPEHGEQYINGWKDHYFTPMLAYFS